MCATPDKATTERFRARKTRQRAYKVIVRETAEPMIFNRRHSDDSIGPYHPGRNVDRRASRTFIGYKRIHRGLHCYLRRIGALREKSETCNSDLTIVTVSFDPADTIAVESIRDECDCQVVVRALHISDRAWKQAGLPAKAKGRKR